MGQKAKIQASRGMMTARYIQIGLYALSLLLVLLLLIPDGKKTVELETEHTVRNFKLYNETIRVLQAVEEDDDIETLDEISYIAPQNEKLEVDIVSFEVQYHNKSEKKTRYFYLGEPRPGKDRTFTEISKQEYQKRTRGIFLSFFTPILGETDAREHTYSDEAIDIFYRDAKEGTLWH